MQVKANEIQSVDLFITEECNMKCTYCFHKQTSDNMSVDVAKRILDKFKILSPDAFKISFFGGEPLLYPKRIIEIAEYAQTLWPVINDVHAVGFFISTNGTNFNEEIFKRFKELNFRIQVSFDGDKETTETHRGNFELVSSNIKKILTVFPETSVRMTYTPTTVGKLSHNVKFIHELGIKKIMHHATMESDWTENDVKMYRQQLLNIYHYRRYLKKTGDDININFIDKVLATINDEVPQELDFCQAGKTYLAVLSSGDIYPCHRAASNRIFKLGNIFNEKRPFARGMFLNINKEFTGCLYKCPAVKTCHTCVITQYLVNGDLTKPLTKYCSICITENQMANEYLNVELTDKRDSMLRSLSSVVADMAEQVNELEKKLEIKNG